MKKLINLHDNNVIICAPEIELVTLGYNDTWFQFTVATISYYFDVNDWKLEEKSNDK